MRRSSPWAHAWPIALAALLSPACRSASVTPDGPSTAGAGPRRVVLIFVDDVGYGDLGCYGSPVLETPNLDRLAAEGMRFTSFYSASSVCSPSRAALLTGCYPPRVGVTQVYFPNHARGLAPGEVTIADVFGELGWATACVGKWHLGHRPEFLPTRQGFDSYFGVPYSNDMDPVEGKSRGLDRAWVENDFSAWNVPLMRDEAVVERPADQTTLTRRYTEEAVRFMRANRERPFFLYLAHTMPHIPVFVSDAFRDEDPAAAYRATLAELDWSVGQITAALRELGLEDDTLLIFASDNGPWLQVRHHGGSRGPLRAGKFTTWEGGMRVPCIVRWPARVPAGSVCRQVAGTIDILPTLAALTGAALPDDRVLDGIDVTSLLTDQRSTAAIEDRLYYYYKGVKPMAVRDARFKLRRAEDGTEALFDLSWDFAEDHDVRERHANVAAELAAAMDAFDASLRANSRSEGQLAE